MFETVDQPSFDEARRWSSTVRSLSRFPARFAYDASAETLRTAVTLTVLPYATDVDDAFRLSVVGIDRHVLYRVVVSSGS